MAILNDNEFTEVEGRSYVNPQVALDESNTFIDNLRSTQEANNQQIKTDTYNLGTAIPSNLGGLVGGESYFTSRYQVPQTVSAVANLRATAQATALNQALQNEQEVWKKRYNDAYRAYQKRNSNGNNPASDDGEVDYKNTDEITGASAEQDINNNTIDTDVIKYTDTGFDNRGTQTNNVAEITRDKSGNITTITINGVPHYGREARARYRDLQRKGVVR